MSDDDQDELPITAEEDIAEHAISCRPYRRAGRHHHQLQGRALTEVPRNAAEGGIRYAKIFDEPSKTKTSDTEKTDIRIIMKRWRDTGVLSHVNRATPLYEDVSVTEGYHEALNRVIEARELFEGLPADLRGQMQNDPGQLTAWIENNPEEARERGLLRPLEGATPPPQPPEPDPAEPGTPDPGSEGE